MSGENLYNKFRAINRNHGCEMDRWSDLDETDRVAWSDLANEIEEEGE